MRVLVTGAGGQLGRDTVLACEAAGDDVLGFDRAGLDVTDRDAMLGAVTSLRPDAVIHCAAWTAVDACESDVDRAFTANALAVRWVAEGCSRIGAHLVSISTDYVFDGSKIGPYHEWDATGPASVYGASKLAGEHEALALGPAAAVARTSWVCGEFGNNMVKTIMRLAGERESLAFVADQVGHPSLCADLAPMLRRLAVDRRSGVHHVTNPTSVYGASKLAGEHEALALGPSAAVARTSWVCGEFGNNMVKTIMRLAAERDSLAFVADQVGHPSLCADLAPMLRRLAVDRRSGVHHVTNQSAVSWYEFAQAVVSAMGKSPSMVAPITTDDLQPPRPAKRPATSVLDNAVLRAAGLPPLPDFRESLATLVTRLMA